MQQKVFLLLLLLHTHAIIYKIAIYDREKYQRMHFIEKFDRENIDGQHLRPPVLAILLETIEREILMDC